jgi:hypothetical protein
MQVIIITRYWNHLGAANELVSVKKWLRAQLSYSAEVCR